MIRRLSVSAFTPQASRLGVFRVPPFFPTPMTKGLPMTDSIQTHQALQREREKIDEQLKALEANETFQMDQLCRKDIEQALAEYEKTPSDLLALFPELAGQLSGDRTTKRAASRTKPKLKRYTNPHTGDVVDARNLNQTTLKEWAKEYGADTVRHWGEEIS